MKEKHLILTDYILCCILALAFSAAPYYLENGDCKVSIAFCITIILNFIFFIILTYTIRKQKNKDIKYWLAYIPIFFSIILGCYLSPVSAAVNLEGPRYLYPIIYTTPIFIIWCLYIYKINCKK